MHEEIDVQSYCDWGVDYLKIDACRGAGYKQHNTSWIKFRAAIDDCSKRRGFPIVMSVESCDDPSPSGCGDWIGKLANLWRTGGDIQATFKSVLNNVRENTLMASCAGPSGGPLGGGRWNDPDMLQVGDIGLSIDEQKSHFAMWCMMAAPLLIGSDISMLSNTSLSILGNTEITAIDQDAKGVQGLPVGPAADVYSCWSKPLMNGDVAVLLLNSGDVETTVTCDLARLGISQSPTKVRDLWAHADITAMPKAGGAFAANLATHATAMYRVTM